MNRALITTKARPWGEPVDVYIVSHIVIGSKDGFVVEKERHLF